MVDDAPTDSTPMTVAKPRRLGRWLGLGIAALAVVALGFAAGRLTLVPPRAPAEPTDDHVLVTVAERTIGQTLDYGGRTARATQPVATNALAGVVTATTQPSADRRSGDVLYAVNGVPVRVVVGSTPFFRAMSDPMTGPDVAQLEKALVALGYLTSADAAYDGDTAKAVAAWQSQLGAPPTGTVALGELVAAPTLPANVTVDPKLVWLGATLNGGEVAVSMGTGAPTFTLPLSPGQLNLVPPDAPMTVEGFGKTWPARWLSSAQDADLGVGEVVTLEAASGGPVCGTECAVVPAEQTWVTVHIEVVPRTTGPTVPVSAITTDAAGQAWVTVVSGEDHEHRQVKVLRSHGGLSVVEGVNVGESVQALAPKGDTPQPGQATPTGPNPSTSPSPVSTP